MNNSLNAEIADQLIRARQSRTQWDARDATPPATLDDAYVIQDIIKARLGAAVSGWKTSAPDPVSVPIAAPIYSELMITSGTAIPASNLSVIGIEGEIAFRIDRDLPSKDKSYTREDLLGAIGDLLPAIEVVNTRMVDGLSGDKKLILADNQSNGALVYGDGFGEWHDLDFSKMEASVSVNGVTEYTGFDGNRAGDIFQLMAWAANHCAGRGTPFRAGDIITTGTYTGLLFVEPGAEVVVEFPGIGSVEVSFPI